MEFPLLLGCDVTLQGQQRDVMAMALASQLHFVCYVVSVQSELAFLEEAVSFRMMKHAPHRRLSS